MVDLPAPEGDDRTSISPRRRMRRTGILADHRTTPNSGPARGTGRQRPSAPARSAVTAAAFDFEHRVFDSRLNSCARKSSLRPTGAARREQRAAGRDMRLQPVDLLADVGLGRKERRLHVEAASRRGLADGIHQQPHLLGEPVADHGGRRATGRPRPSASAPRSRRCGRGAASFSAAPSACRAVSSPVKRRLRERPAAAASSAARNSSLSTGSGDSSTPRSASRPSALARRDAELLLQPLAPGRRRPSGMPR